LAISSWTEEIRDIVAPKRYDYGDLVLCRTWNQISSGKHLKAKEVKTCLWQWMRKTKL